MTIPMLMDFAGTWTLNRDIEQVGSPPARFVGTAILTPDGRDLHYHETGQLIVGAAPPMQAERRYLWRQTATEISVFFHDGRPFHTFSPVRPSASHWCDPDDYRVQYDFTSWPVWHSIWRVRGPRKDYHMLSHYRRD